MLIRSDTRSNPLAIENVLTWLNAIANQKQENFVVLSFDSANDLISRRLVYLGSANSITVHAREVYSLAVSELATSIIICHNHPAGDPRPSADDKRTTQRLVECGEILNISLIDHVIVSANGYYSFAEHGLVKTTTILSR